MPKIINTYGLPAVIYMVVFFIACVYTISQLIFNTSNSELSGVFPMVVTMPWSLLLFNFLDKSGYINWYDSFAGNHIVYGLLALLPMVIYASINTFILYMIFGRKKEI